MDDSQRSPIRILLAEDNEDDAVLIQEALMENRFPFMLDVVKNGEEALAFLRREGVFEKAPLPSLLLLDINMPSKNGLQVLKEMKAESALKNIPVIVLTTSNREEDVVSSYAEGACSFITKPSRYEEFRDRIKTFGLYWAQVIRLPVK